MRLSFEKYCSRNVLFFSVNTGDFSGGYLETPWLLYFGESNIQNLSLPISSKDNNLFFWPQTYKIEKTYKIGKKICIHLDTVFKHSKRELSPYKESWKGY